MNLSEKYGFSADCAAIRREVFINEQGFKNEFDDIDEKAEHVVIYVGENPAATGRAFKLSADGGEYAIGRVAVKKEYRGRNLGRRVMELLCEKVAQNGAKTVVVSAQLQAQGFYASLGFIPSGEVYFDEHCPHRKMVKALSRKPR